MQIITCKLLLFVSTSIPFYVVFISHSRRFHEISMQKNNNNNKTESKLKCIWNIPHFLGCLWAYGHTIIISACVFADLLKKQQQQLQFTSWKCRLNHKKAMQIKYNDQHWLDKFNKSTMCVRDGFMNQMESKKATQRESELVLCGAIELQVAQKDLIDLFFVFIAFSLACHRIIWSSATWCTHNGIPATCPYTLSPLEIYVCVCSFSRSLFLALTHLEHRLLLLF